MTPDLVAAKLRADRLAAALEHSGIGDWTYDAARDVMDLSPTAARLASVQPGEHQGWERLRGHIHPDDRDRARQAAQRAIEETGSYEVEYRLRGETGWRWILARGRVDLDDQGNVRGLVGTLEDIHRRKREEEADRLLARIGETVATSVDVPSMLDELGRALIERFADGCAIDLLIDDAVQRVVLVTRDPVKADLVRELEERFPTPMDAEAGNVMAIRSGQPHLFPVIDDSILRAASASDEHLDLWYRIEMRSVMCVPLIARGRTIGAISIVSHTEGLHFDEQDLALAQEVARRAALAIDTAQAHEQAERIAERMTRLQSLTAALSEALTIDQVASVVMRHGVADLGASAGVLVALTGGDEIEVIATIGYGEGVGVDRGTRWPVDLHVPAAEAVRTGRAVFIGSLEELGTFDAARPVSENRAWAAIPLLRQGTPNGAILWAYRDARTFTRAESGLMYSIASLAEQALERAMLFEAEREARAAAELANGTKTRFLAMMSHELRTPLNAIVGYADLMAHGVLESLTPQQQGYIERIRGSATFLAQIIHEILAFSQLEAGREEVFLEEIDARDVVRAAAEMVRPMTLAGGLELDVALPEQAVPITSDRRKLTQIVLNLMSNAVKFTERGSVAVSLETQGEHVLVRVRDTGVGIPHEAISRVFDPFTQVDSSPTRRQGGTGLGLTVAAQLARLLGGRIEATSEPGRGSTFTVTLPLAVEATTPVLTIEAIETIDRSST